MRLVQSDTRPRTASGFIAWPLALDAKGRGFGLGRPSFSRLEKEEVEWMGYYVLAYCVLLAAVAVASNDPDPQLHLPSPFQGHVFGQLKSRLTNHEHSSTLHQFTFTVRTCVCIDGATTFPCQGPVHLRPQVGCDTLARLDLLH